MEYRILGKNDSEDEISAFVTACNDACEAKFLLAEKKIADVLRTIADSPRLFAQFRGALSGYDRIAEFQKSQTKVGGRSKLAVPQNQSKLMAYVFCLLMEIDSGKRSLREFLDEYFYHTNPTEEYALFASALLVPFRDVTEYVFYNGVESYAEEETVDSTLRETVKSMLQEMNSITNESSLVSMKLKQELFMFARAVESSLTPNRIDLIKPLLTGYKNTVLSCPLRDRLAPYFDKLFRLLTTAEIL